MCGDKPAHPRSSPRGAAVAGETDHVERGSDAADRGNVTFERGLDSAIHEGNGYQTGSAGRCVHLVFPGVASALAPCRRRQRRKTRRRRRRRRRVI